MKKIICLILALLLCLCGCSQQPSERGEPAFLCLPAEQSRLYALSPAGDTMELLWDEACSCHVRQGDRLYAAFQDGTVRLYDGKTGEKTTLFTAEDAVSRLYVLGENDILYSSFSLRDGVDLYRWKNGTTTQLSENNFYIYQLYVTENTLLYNTYDDATGDDVLVGLDLDSGEERWRIAKGGYPAMQQGDTVYVNRDEAFFTVSGKDGSLTPVEPSCVTAEKELLHVGSGGLLVNDYGYTSGTPGVFFADKGGLRKLDIRTDAGSCYAQVLDAEGDLVLLRSYINAECPELGEGDAPYYYSANADYLVNTADGTVLRELDLHSLTTQMFAAGDFPVVDSSTARKPVTRDLYRTFCLEAGIPGALPVCNTTHGAWLAMADRTSDLALLAAPTEEEQAYLREKGVEVEMKLYGGDGLVFIGNNACGVTDLTLENIRAIYRGEITNWSELGGVDAPIRVLYRDDQSGSQRLFERMVWKDEPAPDFQALGFTVLDAMNSIVNECLSDPYSIGYSIMTYLKDVYGEEELLAYSLGGVEAVPVSVADGTYPLATQGYVVIRADEGEESPARRLYDWFGSPICDELLTQNGITPLHEEG